MKDEEEYRDEPRSEQLIREQEISGLCTSYPHPKSISSDTPFSRLTGLFHPSLIQPPRRDKINLGPYIRRNIIRNLGYAQCTRAISRRGSSVGIRVVGEDDTVGGSGVGSTLFAWCGLWRIWFWFWVLLIIFMSFSSSLYSLSYNILSWTTILLGTLDCTEPYIQLFISALQTLCDPMAIFKARWSSRELSIIPFLHIYRWTTN